MKEIGQTVQSTEEALRKIGEPELAHTLGISLEVLRSLLPEWRKTLHFVAVQSVLKDWTTSSIPNNTWFFAKEGGAKPPDEVWAYVLERADKIDVSIPMNHPAMRPVWAHCYLHALRGLLRPPPGV